MQTIEQISNLRGEINLWRQQGLKIAFVPTMGNLHQGHIALVEKAKLLADKVVASIFVNPMQFGATEDIGNYPRTMAADQEKLLTAGCDLLFTPTPAIIYPKGLDQQSYVEVPNVSQHYCGESRPGHFRGVTTVVCKLFNLVQPDIACFGLKDYQQVQVIQTMVEDLSMPIEIIAVETVREASGLALSSRNNYLNKAEKNIAPALNQNLKWLAQAIRSNDDFVGLAQKAASNINMAGMKTDYIHICHARTLQPASKDDKELVILAAAHCGKARLIDNLRVTLA
ncbi:pantoate--beta-alanine ligase [Colwellia sp. MB02u-18]|uniref:pantoate--beta-alanine ligase n=1 Tax=unclassified Colwellia TaxID=196834 RepID=UPI0015F3A7E4|nr:MULTISPECIES: pantoate--beta-alanine ligase [unclassified Colwellia]MBA6224637.1 pantoate--beta-alanine ligase [Colwellia sp. MB3u-45]MBA6268051.1 pantoate--beta-alanine ligase [Colwellia sp. MB3u-43]MBA6322503.1 pantoate--beta-alanine ligase [Colwellia sp. MB02u-19]MBA6326081.1 pantoate--beta-alanine ligase [Colwellia sp. MB02u-18]MBA6331540.1 pantoate--beta-alanine ligase [Colwellia sp. MB02u-12]